MRLWRAGRDFDLETKLGEARDVCFLSKVGPEGGFMEYVPTWWEYILGWRSFLRRRGEGVALLVGSLLALGMNRIEMK